METYSIVKALQYFVAKYSDYDTMLNIIFHDPNNSCDDYADICHGTASAVQGIFFDKKLIEVKQEDIINELVQGRAIDIHINYQNQSHSIIVIPDGYNYHIVQSMGGTLGAYFKTYDLRDIMDVLLGDDFRLTRAADRYYKSLPKEDITFTSYTIKDSFEFISRIPYMKELNKRRREWLNTIYPENIVEYNQWEIDTTLPSHIDSLYLMFTLYDFEVYDALSTGKSVYFYSFMCNPDLPPRYLTISSIDQLRYDGLYLMENNTKEISYLRKYFKRNTYYTDAPLIISLR